MKNIEKQWPPLETREEYLWHESLKTEEQVKLRKDIIEQAKTGTLINIDEIPQKELEMKIHYC